MAVNHIKKLQERGWYILGETESKCFMAHDNEPWIATVSTAWGDITWETKTEELILSIKRTTN